MTRFARAKGSKSSNERVPDEATPWNVMKMQLEDSQASAKEMTKKPKNAKQLLAEKYEPFYSDNTGNVNHEWAAFDDVTESKSGKDKSGKLHEIKHSKKDKKKIKSAALLHVSNGNSSDHQIVEVVGKAKIENKNDNQAIGEAETSGSIDTIETKTKKMKKKKKNISNDTIGSELGSEKLVEPKNVDEDNTSNPTIDSNSKDTLENQKPDSKNKKRAKKSRKSKPTADPGQVDNQSENVTSGIKESPKQELASANSDKKDGLPSSIEKSTERLSKRQKRNQKKQRRIMSEKNESNVDAVKEESQNKELQKEENTKGFDVVGNDWSNEVKFGKQTNQHQLSRTVTNEGDNGVGRKKEKLNKKKMNLEKASEGEEAQNDNPIPDNSENPKDDNTESKKAQKRKGGKNDNKEYKRRKPEEGAVKMIINGNEIEVVKYDGFPVKKEDADRLRELKKNMIIKGIPRSEINVAMKLERRKAEKALARERKRVCFHCRRSGHNLSDCPDLGRDESGTGICYKCGSAEHTHFECKVVKGQEFRHASCFICREQGHIAKQCPDNPKGLYPQGGSCKLCGDVTHLRKDCPDLIKEKEETNITADKIVGSQLESIEEDQTNVKIENNDNKPKSKVIKF